MSQYVSLCLENDNLLQVCKENICFCYRRQHFSGCSLTSNAIILLCDIAAQVKVQSIVLCLQYSQEILLAAPQQTTPASTTGRQLWLRLARQSISLDSAPLHCTLSRRIGPTSPRKQNTAVATTINKNVYHSGCCCLTTSFSDNNMQQTIYLWCNIQLGIQCDPFIAKCISARLWMRDLLVCMYIRTRNTQPSCLGMSICAHSAPPACTWHRHTSPWRSARHHTHAYSQLQMSMPCCAKLLQEQLTMCGESKLPADNGSIKVIPIGVTTHFAPISGNANFHSANDLACSPNQTNITIVTFCGD